MIPPEAIFPFAATAGLSALGGFQGFSQKLASVVEDSTTLFQDAFDAFEETPERLRPSAPALQDSFVDVPNAAKPYHCKKLSSDGRRKIPLAQIKETRMNKPTIRLSSANCCRAAFHFQMSSVR